MDKRRDEKRKKTVRIESQGWRRRRDDELGGEGNRRREEALFILGFWTARSRSEAFFLTKRKESCGKGKEGKGKSGGGQVQGRPKRQDWFVFSTE